MVATDTTTRPPAIGLLSAALALVERIDPPAGVSVHVDHHTYPEGLGPDAVEVSFHPTTYERRRELMARPAFAGATWDFVRGDGYSRSATTVDGIRVTVFGAREGQR